MFENLRSKLTKTHHVPEPEPEVFVQWRAPDPATAPSEVEQQAEGQRALASIRRPPREPQFQDPRRIRPRR